MLLEDGSLSEGSQWRKVKVGLERDPRYRAVTGGSSQREEWFKEYVRSLSSSDKVGQFARDFVQFFFGIILSGYHVYVCMYV